MYVVFMDESGQPGGWNKEEKYLTPNSSKFFTLSGFMIDADNILEITSKLRDIKIKYGLKETCEIKWSCSYAKLGLTLKQYKNMKKDIINMISQYNNSVIGIIMDSIIVYAKNQILFTKHKIWFENNG